ARRRSPHGSSDRTAPSGGVYAQEGGQRIGYPLAVCPSQPRRLGKGREMAPTIDLRTELPGPRSTEILARKQRVIADAKSIYLPIVIDHAHGVAVTDVDGNTFLDWTGGIGCLNVGHTNEAVSAALHAQVDRFLHTDFTMVPYESYIELAAAAREDAHRRPQEGRVL